MKKLIYTMVLCVGSLILASCGDFLEEYSNDKVYASSCEDLNEVLIGNGYLKNDVNNQVNTINSSGAHYWPYLHLMDDDAEEYLTGKTDLNAYQASVAAMRNFYIWAKEPWKKINGDDLYDWDWKRLYQCISYLNVINAYVDEFPNDPVGHFNGANEHQHIEHQFANVVPDDRCRGKSFRYDGRAGREL